MIFRRRDRDGAGARARTVRITGPCPHVEELPAPEPEPGSPDGCAECLANGTTWVHVRMCLTCGHVGCCDTGPYRHATAHHQETGHPVMRSFEPGERWRWCYVDETLV